jgi:hypothetical protein
MFKLHSSEVNELHKLVNRILDHRDFYSILLSGSNINRLEKINEDFESFLAAEESWADCANDEPDTDITHIGQ